MLTGKKNVVIANVFTDIDVNTGDNIKSVTNAKKLVGTVELVGIQTAQVGQAQGFNLIYSVEISRIHYSNEKYMYFDNNLFEIKTMSKAKSPSNMLLNVQKLDDLNIKSAIEVWINDNL